MDRRVFRDVSTFRERDFVRYGTRVSLSLSIAMLMLPASLLAQAPTPTIVEYGTRRADVGVSAAEAAFNLKVLQTRLSDAISPRRIDFPKDSIRAVLADSARAWLARLPDTSVRGAQWDFYASVAIVAGQDSLAQRRIAERLATPGLSFSDRAFTYMFAVQGFADAEFPGHMAIAESYLTRLDAMGAKAIRWRVQARQAMIDAAYQSARRADVVRYGMPMLELVFLLPFEARRAIVSGSFYTMMAQSLIGTPNGQATIASIEKMLLASATPSREDLARDSTFRWMGDQNLDMLRRVFRLTPMTNAAAPPIVASLWLNAPVSRSLRFPLNDGKIRLVALGGLGCPGCVASIFALQRLHVRYPDVEVIFVTSTDGFWGNRHVDADEEVPKLTERYRKTFGVTFPIALWAGKKHPTQEGGMRPEINPNWETFHPVAIVKPQLYVIDGRGIIRRTYEGPDRDNMVEIETLVQLLKQETTP